MRSEQLAELPIEEFSVASMTQQAIEFLRAHQPSEGGYYGGFSGGKDSVVIKELARLAGVPVQWYYCLTGLDPPEVVKFIKTEHPDVEIDRPVMSFWNAARKIYGVPMRRFRWCCEVLKTPPLPPESRVILGIRSEESAVRARYLRPVVRDRKRGAWNIHPIAFWRNRDVWQFIYDRNLPYCNLYDEGRNRLGCIGCPLSSAGQRRRDFARWPRYEQAWRLLFRDVWATRPLPFLRKRFATWEDWWRAYCWQEYRSKPDACTGIGSDLLA